MLRKTNGKVARNTRKAQKNISKTIVLSHIYKMLKPIRKRRSAWGMKVMPFKFIKF